MAVQPTGYFEPRDVDEGVGFAWARCCVMARGFACRGAVIRPSVGDGLRNRQLTMNQAILEWVYLHDEALKQSAPPELVNTAVGGEDPDNLDREAKDSLVCRLLEELRRIQRVGGTIEDAVLLQLLSAGDEYDGF